MSTDWVKMLAAIALLQHGLELAINPPQPTEEAMYDPSMHEVLIDHVISEWKRVYRPALDFDKHLWYTAFEELEHELHDQTPIPR